MDARQNSMRVLSFTSIHEIEKHFHSRKEVDRRATIINIYIYRESIKQYKRNNKINIKTGKYKRMKREGKKTKVKDDRRIK